MLAGAALLLAGLAGFGGAKLAGAGGDESPAAPKATERSDAAADAATVDPCALITEAEVGSAVGPATVAKSGSTCRFTPTGTSAFAGVAIAVSDKTLQRPADFRIGLEVIAKAAGTTVEPVTGVGDEAYITRITSSIPMVQIAVRKGNRIFSLVALGGASLEDGGVAVVSNLAGKAVGRF